MSGLRLFELNLRMQYRMSIGQLRCIVPDCKKRVQDLGDLNEIELED